MQILKKKKTNKQVWPKVNFASYFHDKWLVWVGSGGFLLVQMLCFRVLKMKSFFFPNWWALVQENELRFGCAGSTISHNSAAFAVICSLGAHLKSRLKTKQMQHSLNTRLGGNNATSAAVRGTHPHVPDSADVTSSECKSQQALRWTS